MTWGPMFHEVAVAERRWLSAGMVRLTLAGEGLSGFASTGIGDEYLRLFFPDPATGELSLPIIEPDGRWRYHEGRPPVRCSTYTVRRFDPRQRALDIDFVVHEGGKASDWACSVAPGETIVINRPRGLYAPPEDLSWQVLVADGTGLPALSRLLEQADPDLPCRVVVEVARPEDVVAIPERPNTQVTWVFGDGSGRSRLGEAIGHLAMPEEGGFLWAAAERDAVRAIKRHARRVRRMATDRCQLVAYWIDDAIGEKAAGEPLDASICRELSAPWSVGAHGLL